MSCVGRMNSEKNSIQQEKQEYLRPLYWGLDPLFSAHIKMTIATFMNTPSFPDYPEVLCFFGHPVHKVEIVGIATDIRQYAEKHKIFVDDGTGVVQCNKWVNEEELLVRRGDLVVVRGQIHSYQNRRELNVTHIRAEEDPHAEIFHWLQVIYLTRHVYMKPFTIPKHLPFDINDYNNNNNNNNNNKTTIELERPEYKWHI
jgi:hypothetical protein